MAADLVVAAVAEEAAAVLVAVQNAGRPENFRYLQYKSYYTYIFYIQTLL